MRSALVRVSLAAACALLASCFTIGTIRGYAGEGEGAPYRGELPPIFEETWAVPLPAGVTLFLAVGPGDAASEPGQTLVVFLHLFVPDGVEVRLERPEVRVSSPAWAAPRELPIVVVDDGTRAGSERSRAPADALVGTAETDRYPGFQLGFRALGPRAETGLPVVDELVIEPPPLRVNGALATPAPVRFRAWERFGVRWAVD